MAASVGWMIVRITCASSAGVTIAAGGVGAHAAGIGPAVAVLRALVVAGRSEQQGAVAVAEREDTCLFAVQPLLDHDLAAGFPESAAEQVVDGSLGLAKGIGHHDALAGREPVGLDDGRTGHSPQVAFRGVGVGEPGKRGCRNPVLGAELLREALGALETRGEPARPEGPDAERGEIVDETRDQRRLGSDHHQPDVFLPAQRQDCVVVGDVERDVAAEPRRSGIARRDQERRAERARRDRPSQGMLASARSDEKDVHVGGPSLALVSRIRGALATPCSSFVSRTGILAGCSRLP
jgi:hypothetical protein